MQQRHVVAHYCSLPDDDAGRVVDEHAAPDHGRRVNVHVKGLRHAVLNRNGQRLRRSKAVDLWVLQGCAGRLQQN